MNGGLNRGRKYTYKFNVDESSKTEEGVSFGEKSNKWLVRVKNKTKSASVRPFIIIAQYDNKEDAEEHYKRVSAV